MPEDADAVAAATCPAADEDTTFLSAEPADAGEPDADEAADDDDEADDEELDELDDELPPDEAEVESPRPASSE